jgi:hypothetical protein
MFSVAWLEPSTVSVGLYFSCSLLNGHGGVRLLKRRLRKARDWGRDVLADEFSEFLCDHPELLLLTLLTISTLRLIHHPEPTFKDKILLNLVGSTDLHGLPLSCSPLSRIPGCTQFTRGRLYLKLNIAFRPARVATCAHPRVSGRRGTPFSLLSHVRSLPFLRNRAPGQRYEEAVQDTG